MPNADKSLDSRKRCMVLENFATAFTACCLVISERLRLTSLLHRQWIASKKNAVFAVPCACDWDEASAVFRRGLVFRLQPDPQHRRVVRKHELPGSRESPLCRSDFEYGR